MNEKTMQEIRRWVDTVTTIIAILLSHSLVCARLERIETTLHLPPYSAFNMVPDAQAHEHHVIEQPVLRTLDLKDYKTLRNDPQIQGETK